MVIMDHFKLFLLAKLAFFVAVVSGTSPPKLCYSQEDFIPEICPYYGVETHYRELGCKPIFSYDGACCPDSYDCSHLEILKSETIGKCYYGGRTYLIDTPLDPEDSKDKCRTLCSCAKGYPPGTSARFVCAAVECPSVFGVYPIEPCYNKYKLDECCPTQYCPPGDSATPPGCTFEGKTYRDGEKINPSDSNLSYKCKSCICTAGKVACDNYRCGMELDHFADIMADGAVPLYYGLDKCCAVGYIYPADTDTVVKTNEVRTSENKCKFGTLELEVGDELIQIMEKCAKCTCIIPPFITCLTDLDCYYS